MLEFLQKNPDGNVDRNAAGADLILRENCTTAVCNTLQAGGVLSKGEDADGALSGFHAPSELEASLAKSELSDNVKYVVIFDPDADEKAQGVLDTLRGASCFYTGGCAGAPVN